MATDEFTSHKTSQVFKMKSAAFCKSSNIVYLITCRRCGQQYVGKTGQPLHPRIDSHRFNIVHRRTEESLVAEHFNGTGHTLADMTVMTIDPLYSHDPCLRKMRESRWIRTLVTSHPFGMNLRVDSLWNLPDDYLCTPVEFYESYSYQGYWTIPIPRSDNKILDVEYKYNVYNNRAHWSWGRPHGRPKCRR